ncbi:hypothetical protein NXV14_21265 [Bacteroides fragilis]|nr:hypothetical protein [Bacteroides fragilis]
MKRVLKLVSSILLLSVMGGHLYADEKANVVKQGTIRGTYHRHFQTNTTGCLDLHREPEDRSYQ